MSVESKWYGQTSFLRRCRQASDLPTAFAQMAAACCPWGDVATFAVHIDLDASDLSLRPGMTGQVQIVVK